MQKGLKNTKKRRELSSATFRAYQQQMWEIKKKFKGWKEEFSFIFWSFEIVFFS